MELPYVEVSHLAASTSFYSAVLQPLGLRFLSSDREPPQCIGTVTYGIQARPGQNDSIPVLQICEAAHPLAPLKLSSLVFTAPSRRAVVDFHASALDANPWLQIQDDDDSRHQLVTHGGVTRALISDLDGNTMEVIYPPPSGASFQVTHNGVPVRQTQSTHSEAGRILNWNYDVATRTSRSVARRPSSTTSHQSGRTRLTPSRSTTHPPPAGSVVSAMSHRSTSRQSEDGEVPVSISPRQSSSKSTLNTTNVVGAILGVATVAGAALAYGMAKDKERRPRHDYEPPMLSRRSTYPEKFPSSRIAQQDDRRSAYGGYPPKPVLPYHQEYEYGPPRVPYPGEYHPHPFAIQDGYAPPRAPFGHDYAPRRMPHEDEFYPREEVLEETDSDDDEEEESPAPRPVQHLTPRSHHSSAPKSKSRSSRRSRAPEDTYQELEPRSHHSSRHSRAPTLRACSEAPAPREPLMIADVETRSHVESRHSVPPKSSHSKSRSYRSQHDPDRDSYVSAKSRRSAATVRRPSPPEVEEIVTTSRRGSQVTTTRISSPGKHGLVIRESSRAPSHRSARDIELPISGVGSSHAQWDDDMDSVAPSDSISCVGSKMSRKSRRAR